MPIFSMILGSLMGKMILDLEKITRQVCRIAREGGKFLRSESLHFKREFVEEKHAHDYVSYVDKESEKRLVTRLHELLPEAGFIAEEGSGSLHDENYCWVIDPLDGTTNYIHGHAPYCVSIALLSREELLIGVVYEVTRDECFWAWKGSKAYLNGHEIHVSSITALNDAFIQLGFPYDVSKFRLFITDLIKRLYGNVGGLRVQGSAASELCYVAAGRFEARIEGCLGLWDIAAGALILQQAGGQLSTFSGGNDFYSGKEVVATNGRIHTTLLDIIDKSLYLYS